METKTRTGELKKRPQNGVSPLRIKENTDTKQPRPTWEKGGGGGGTRGSKMLSKKPKKSRGKKKLRKKPQAMPGGGRPGQLRC